MKAKIVAAGLLAAGAWHGTALADGSIEDRLAKMEQRIQYLEQRVAAQDRTIVEKDRQIAELTEGARGEGHWFDAVEVGGVIEIEASHSDADGDTVTDIDAATIDLGVSGQLNDWAGAEIAFTYNGDDDKLEVDEAFVAMAEPESPVSVVVGRHYLPFGAFATNLISDPLTLNIGETREDALQLAFENGGTHAAAFAFNGDVDRDGDDQIQTFGATLGHMVEGEDSAFGLTVSYLSDIGDSDGIGDGIADSAANDAVAGAAVSAVASFGEVSLIGEYVTALDAFATGELDFGGQGAEPSAWTTEAALGFDLMGRAATAAVSYQGTDEALALELPENRLLVGISVELGDGVGLGVEWARDEDYSVGDGGSGSDSTTATAQLATEF